MPTQPLTLISVLILQDQCRYLVRQRPNPSHLAGLWEFPGGKQRDSESSQQAALRELMEECAITEKQLEIPEESSKQRLSLLHCSAYQDHVANLQISFFLAKLKAKERTIASSSSALLGWQWMPLITLQSVALPPANLVVIEKLIELANA